MALFSRHVEMFDPSSSSWSFPSLVVLVVGAWVVGAENYDYCEPKLRLCDPPSDHTMCLFPEPGPASRCTPSIQEPLTATEKKRILFWHNKFRSNVANGSERNKSRKLPTSSNMRQLYWDSELEALSERWADQCSSSAEPMPHDKCRNTKRFSVGQNVGTRRVNGSWIEKQAPQMVISWYKESKNFEPNLVNNFTLFDDEKVSSKQFANIIWADTFALGCARIIFQEDLAEAVGERTALSTWTIERLVCNYGPAGNQVGKPIYKRGVPCADCPNGTECSQVFRGLCAIRDFAKKEGQHAVESQGSTEEATTREVDETTATGVRERNNAAGSQKSTTAGINREVETEMDGAATLPKETYVDDEPEMEDAATQCLGDECWKEEKGATTAEGTTATVTWTTDRRHPNIFKIEEIMNAPKSTARLLFEGIGKKAPSDARDNQIISNENRKGTRAITNGRKVGRDLLQSMRGASLQESTGTPCRCVKLVMSGAQASRARYAKSLALALATLIVRRFGFAP